MSRVLDLWAGMTGTVLPFAGSAAPIGWLLCYGQAVSRTTYANLFAAIGTAYGAGDGSTTFNVPDLRGRVAAGKDDMGGTAASRLNVSTTGTTTNASANITAIPSTAGLAIGMAVFGAGIPAGATIASITSATAITISAMAGGWHQCGAAVRHRGRCHAWRGRRLARPQAGHRADARPHPHRHPGSVRPFAAVR